MDEFDYAPDIHNLHRFNFRAFFPLGSLLLWGCHRGDGLALTFLLQPLLYAVEFHGNKFHLSGKEEGWQSDQVNYSFQLDKLFRIQEEPKTRQ